MTAPGVSTGEPTTSKQRLDRWLVENGSFETRARAQAAIAAGCVFVDGAPALKPAAPVTAQTTIRVAGPAHPFVSRGGVKLAAGLDAFGVDPSGLICLDLGASTGGFTDALLRRGARKVWAVDVGVGQLHPSIAADDRVVRLDKTHARDLTRALVTEEVDLIVADVSFISLRKALPPALSLAAPGALLVALVKPQFEVGPDGVGKGGIVRDGAERGPQAAAGIAIWLAAELGWASLGVIDSPIAGGDGNREFLLGAKRQA